MFKFIKLFKNFFKNIFARNSKVLYEFNELIINDYLPLKIEYGKIYFSEKYKIVKFMCPNNCGLETTLKIGEKVDVVNKIWTAKVSNKKITIRNSIGSANTCGAHYFIINNKIDWLENL